MYNVPDDRMTRIDCRRLRMTCKLLWIRRQKKFGPLRESMGKLFWVLRMMNDAAFAQ